MLKNYSKRWKNVATSDAINNNKPYLNTVQIEKYMKQYYMHNKGELLQLFRNYYINLDAPPIISKDVTVEPSSAAATISVLPQGTPTSSIPSPDKESFGGIEVYYTTPVEKNEDSSTYL